MSFGIVTSMKFRTMNAPPENVLFYYPFNWNRTEARAGWDAWQAYASGETNPVIPAEMNVRWLSVKSRIVNDTSGVILLLLQGTYHGSEGVFY